jgi:hypothetical protein
MSGKKAEGGEQKAGKRNASSSRAFFLPAFRLLPSAFSGLTSDI